MLPDASALPSTWLRIACRNSIIKSNAVQQPASGSYATLEAGLRLHVVALLKLVRSYKIIKSLVHVVQF